MIFFFEMEEQSRNRDWNISLTQHRVYVYEFGKSWNQSKIILKFRETD